MMAINQLLNRHFSRFSLVGRAILSVNSRPSQAVRRIVRPKGGEIVSHAKLSIPFKPINEMRIA